MTTAVSRAVREFARRVAGRYPVQQVILFGSRARGTQRTDSDADVAVLLRGIRGHFVDTKLEMVDIAYDVCWTQGSTSSPCPFGRTSGTTLRPTPIPASCKTSSEKAFPFDSRGAARQSRARCCLSRAVAQLRRSEWSLQSGVLRDV